jgi:hypothetical protein
MELGFEQAPFAQLRLLHSIVRAAMCIKAVTATSSSLVWHSYRMLVSRTILVREFQGEVLENLPESQKKSLSYRRQQWRKKRARAEYLSELDSIYVTFCFLLDLESARATASGK